MVCVTSRLPGSAACLTPPPTSSTTHPALGCCPGLRIQSGLPPPPELACLRKTDTGPGTPGRVTSPGVAGQAASPRDNFQWRHACHGKVKSSKRKSCDSWHLRSLPASYMPPLLPSSWKTCSPLPHTPASGDPSLVPNAPQTGQLSGAQIPVFLPGLRSQSPPQVMQDRNQWPQ